jgi:hypothetical protein
MSFQTMDPSAAAAPPPPPAVQEPFGAPQHDPFVGMGQTSDPYPYAGNAPAGDTPIPGDRSCWSMVNIGLLLMQITVYISLTSTSIQIATFCVSSFGVFDQIPAILAILYFVLIWGVGLIGSICHLVGVGLCIAAPSEYGAKGLAITTLVLEAIGFLFACPGGFIPILNIGLVPASALMLLAAIFFLIFFWRACALALNNRGLAYSCRNLAIALAVLVVLPIVLGGMAIVGLLIAGQSETIRRAISNYQREAALGSIYYVYFGAALVVGIALLWAMFYILTLFKVRGAVRRHLAKLG